MEGDLQRLVGRRLRAHRHGLGVSQEKLADDLGVHRTYVGILERGEHNLSLQTVERLAEQLGLEPRDLLDDA